MSNIPKGPSWCNLSDCFVWPAGSRLEMFHFNIKKSTKYSKKTIFSQQIFVIFDLNA